MSTFFKLGFQNKWLVLASLCLMYSASFFHRTAPAILGNDLLLEFDLSASSLGLVSSLTMLGYALTQIPAGILTDRFGARRVLAIYQATAVFCIILFALSYDYSSILASRLLLGFTLAISVPGLKLLADYFPAHMFGRASSLMLTCGTVGSLISSSPLAFSNALFGWRNVMLFVAFFTALLALISYFGFKSEKAPRPHSQNKNGIYQSIKLVLKNRQFISLLIYFSLILGNMFLLITMWWGIFLTQACQLSPIQAGNILATQAIVPIFCIPLIAYLSDKLFKSRKVILLANALITMLAMLYIIYFQAELSLSELYIVGLMATLPSACCGTICFTALKECTPHELLGTANGILTSGAPIFAAFGQVIFGLIISTSLNLNFSLLSSYSNAFGFIFFTSLIAFIAICFFQDTFANSQTH